MLALCGCGCKYKIHFIHSSHENRDDSGMQLPTFMDHPFLHAYICAPPGTVQCPGALIPGPHMAAAASGQKE
eukprot:1160330-Pelagomonas_calceolata.AAC.10